MITARDTKLSIFFLVIYRQVKLIFYVTYHAY